MQEEGETKVAAKSGTKKLSWQALEHAYYEKTPDWYWIVGIVGITLAILSFVFGNGMFGVVMLIGTLAVLLHAGRVPRIVTIELSQGGVRVGSQFFPYRNLHSFSLDEESDPPILVLDTKTPFIADMHLFIEGIHTDDIRDFLLDHLDEKYHTPSFTHNLAHYLGF